MRDFTAGGGLRATSPASSEAARSGILGRPVNVPPSDSPGPVVRDPAIVDALRGVLTAADFTATGVARRLPAVRVGLRAQDLPLYERQVTGTDALSVLIKLFLLGLPVAEDQAQRALAPLVLQELEDAMILTVVDGTVTSLTQMQVVADLLLVGDRDGEMLANRDWVAVSSPTARLLEFLTIRRPVRSSLDLGCGSGMHALLATRHSDRVTAVDLNERALAFTRFNAQLNGVSNVDCRQGSWFEPVAGQTFDMIVSNPPFVVSPDSELLFRDSPLPADELFGTLVTEAGAHLVHGGHANILCNWALTEGEDWSDPPRRWLRQAGCDAFILHFGTDEPMSYAALWNAPLRAQNPSAFLPAVDRWLDYYRNRRIRALCSGAVVLRRRTSGQPWIRAMSLPRLPDDPAGEDLLRLFEGQDWLSAGGSDERLLDSTFGLLDRHEVRQILTYRGGAYDSHRCAVGRTSGLRFDVAIDPQALQVLLRLDGSRSLRAIAGEVAGELGFDDIALMAEAATASRELLQHGLLTPQQGLDARSPSS